MTQLAGLHAALPTAFDAAFGYHPVGQRRLTENVIALGLDGVFVGGSTAEVHALTLDERRRALADVAAAGAEKLVLLAHVGAMREPDALALAGEAERLGYAAVASTPPFYSPLGAAERRAFFERLVGATGLPVFVYHIPSMTGLDLDAAELLDLLAIPGIVGMKLSAPDIGFVQRAKAALPDRLILFGCDDLLGVALAAGADGGVGSTYNLFGRRVRALRDAVDAGDLTRMRTLQADLNTGIDALEEAGIFPALKAALAAFGVPCGPCRPPFGVLAPAAEAKLLAALRSLPGT